MHDYITWLLDCLDCLDFRPEGEDLISEEEVRQRREAEAAYEALESALSGEQHALYLAFEERHNAVRSLETDRRARRAFLLARALYR